MSKPARNQSGEGHAPMRLVWGAIALLAVLPALGTFTTPWIAEDAAILGRMADEGAAGDVVGAQYGMHLVRFHRPVVSFSWWLQESLFGTSVLPARVGNLFCHALAGVLASLVVCRLGFTRWAAAVAGATLVLFPDQGGTVTWIAGRTDVLGALLMTGAVLAAVDRRALLAGVLAFLACATKEFSYVLPVWAFALGASRSDAASACESWLKVAWRAMRPSRATVAVLAGVIAALLVRRVALGVWLGGYPGGSSLDVASLPAAASTLLVAMGPLLISVLVLAVLGSMAGTLSVPLLLAGLVAGGAALLPLLPLVAGGVLEDANRRLLFTADVGFAFACAASVAKVTRVAQVTQAPAGVRAGWRRLTWIAIAGLLLLRGRDAWIDTHEWAASGAVGQERVDAAAALVAAEAGSARPVLITGFPRTHGGAYCLHWGVADRFRAPFPTTPRPVWPLRALFEQGEDERDFTDRVDGDGALWPWRAQPLAPPLEVGALTVGEPADADAGWDLDESVFLGGEDLSTRIDVRAPAHAHTGLEVIVFTELGYASVLVGLLDASGTAQFSLRTLLAASNGTTTLGQAMLQAADVGARHAYCEFRVLRADGACLARSDWVEIRWDDALVERAFRAVAGSGAGD